MRTRPGRPGPSRLETGEDPATTETVGKGPGEDTDPTAERLGTVTENLADTTPDESQWALRRVDKPNQTCNVAELTSRLTTNGTVSSCEQEPEPLIFTLLFFTSKLKEGAFLGIASETGEKTTEVREPSTQEPLKVPSTSPPLTLPKGHKRLLY